MGIVSCGVKMHTAYNPVKDVVALCIRRSGKEQHKAKLFLQGYLDANMWAVDFVPQQCFGMVVWYRTGRFLLFLIYCVGCRGPPFQDFNRKS